MGQTAVDVTLVSIDESTSQQNTTADGTRTDLREVDIIPVTTTPDVSNQYSNDYNVLIGTANAVATTTVNIASRTIRVLKSIGTPVETTAFFTSLLTTGSPKIHAIQKTQGDGFVEYEIFYTNEGAGAVTLDLFVTTIDIPVGATAATFPNLPAAADPVVSIAILRESNGLVNTYDYFMLSTQ